MFIHFGWLQKAFSVGLDAWVSLRGKAFGGMLIRVVVGSWCGEEVLGWHNRLRLRKVLGLDC